MENEDNRDQQGLVNNEVMRQIRSIEKLDTRISWWLYKEIKDQTLGNYLDFKASERVFKLLRDKSWH